MSYPTQLIKYKRAEFQKLTVEFRRLVLYRQRSQETQECQLFCQKKQRNSKQASLHVNKI